MRTFVAALIQMTWGLPQTILGALIAVGASFRGCSHHGYRTAIVTLWELDRGVSLGPFIFVPRSYPPKRIGPLITHEYGHTLQSLILGPLYLPLILLPSLIWAGTPALTRKRATKHISYYSFYTERWANHLSHHVTKELPEGYDPKRS